MDPRSPICRYPHCADYDEHCSTGINRPCIVFDGEHLAREKAWANRPSRAWPNRVLNFIIVVVLSGAIFLAFRAANAAMGISQ